MGITELRRTYHQRLCTEIIRINQNNKNKNIEFPNFADGSNKSSIKIAQGIVDHIGFSISHESIKEQTVGGRFEVITKDFLEQSFANLHHLRPGRWQYSTQLVISKFEQYEHLAYLEEIVRQDKNLKTAFGGDYIIKPDIVVGRWPVTDDEINQSDNVIDGSSTFAKLTPFRQSNYQMQHMILHASISCKWTIRSDRSQNTRTEALNLIRNRKGSTPHIVVVTGEPLPTRIASLALGTGDMDCVYHFALNELVDVLTEIGNEDQLDILTSMIDGRRLRDISDLPFDLAT
jgi:hypothetical protein